MGISLDVANALENAIDEKISRAVQKTTRADGTVTRIDVDGTVYIMLDGSDTETPVSNLTAAVSEGDRVIANVSNGSLTIDGNITAPATDDTLAKTAIVSAEAAIRSADEAASAAASAVASAETAAEAAARAEETAEDIEAIAVQAAEDAAEASAAASSASASATSALESAHNANIHLSEVEQVVGTLNWISEHGTYVSQAGQEFDPDKVYYIAVYTYALTSDVEIVEGKTYYTRTGSGTDEDPYVYTPVEEPDVEDLPTYYEVTSVAYRGVTDPVPEDIDSYYILVVDESVQNYLASHLAQTDYGLNLMFDGTTDYVHIGTVDGSFDAGVYLFVAGGIRSAYTEYGVTIGPPSSFHVVVTNTALNFYQGAALVAYVNNNELNIPAAVIEKSIKLGDWQFQSRPSGNMGVFYVG